MDGGAGIVVGASLVASVRNAKYRSRFCKECMAGWQFVPPNDTSFVIFYSPRKLIPKCDMLF